MPLHGKTKQEVVFAFRNAEIMQAARKVFAENGFSQASVADIAREAGVAKGTLYLYYRSKREIYWASLRSGLVELGQELKGRMEVAETVEAKIRAFMETKISYFERNHDFFRLYYAESSNVVRHPAYSHEHFVDLYLEQLEFLKSVLREALEAGAIRPVSLDAAAFAILDLTRGAILHRLLGWSKTSTREDVACLFDLIWKGLGAQ